MTKEEFKKQVKRYFDSINPGRGMLADDVPCRGVRCSDCMFYHGYDKCCGPYYLFEIMEEFEKWVKEHPVITNKEKLEQIFDVKIDAKHSCPPVVGKCADMASDCEACRKWWVEEYKDTNGGENK